MGEPLRQRPELAQEGAVRRKKGTNDGGGRLLIGLADVHPARVTLGFAQGLASVFGDPLAKALDRCRIRRTAEKLVRPGAEQRLQQQVAVVRVRRPDLVEVDEQRLASWHRSARPPRPTPAASRRVRAGARAHPRRAWCRGSRSRSWHAASRAPAPRSRRAARRGPGRNGRGRRRPRSAREAAYSGRTAYPRGSSPSPDR